MASKQRWLSSLGARDVYHTMDAFEQMNLITIELTIMLRNSAGRRGPWIVATAYIQPAAPAGRVLLASAELNCSTTEFESLDTAAFRVLYALDLVLDGLDPRSADKKSAAPGAT